MKNMFERPLVIYEGAEHIGTAWREADELMASAFAGDYKRVSSKTLAEFVRHGLLMADENDACSLLRNVQMPLEGRAAMMWQPSYAVIAAAIWLKNNYPNFMDKEMDASLARMMNRSFAYGIVIHGYDDRGLKWEIMKMLASAGARQFIEEHSEFAPVFTEYVAKVMDSCHDVAWEENPEGECFYSEGHGQEIQNMKIRHVQAAWQGKEYAVFTYGTLRRGQSANSLMTFAIWGGHGSLKDYAMYNLGCFPGIVEKKSETVLGEVWFVDARTFAKLDAYEGEGTLYLRKKVNIQTAYGEMEAWAYIYNGKLQGEILREGWKPNPKDYVWYATYGASLSSKRFACYIQGGYCAENDKWYEGCSNPALWTDSHFEKMKGEIYFGNYSQTWGGGVAFFAPNRCGNVYVRLYRITREQLREVQRQEGASEEWYGRTVCLGTAKNGEAIFTLTSAMKRAHCAPTIKYLDLIEKALVDEGGLSKSEARRYLERCTRNTAEYRKEN